MIEYFTVEQTLQRVTRLSRTRLTALIEVEAVIPAQADAGPLFGPGDLARLDLLCEFADIYDMEPEALAVMITVIDQLHTARRDRHMLLDAVRAEAPEVQERIAQALAASEPSEDD